MSAHPRLLDHPFYQAWNRGELSTETLSAYHRSYGEFIKRFPSYWQRVVDTFQQDLPRGASIVNEESEHILLWELWGKGLNQPPSFPRLNALVDAFDHMAPSELLGAIQAFETQQPEVARTKREGLLRFFGFREEALAYFDEHLDETNHIAYGTWLGENFADRREYGEGFERGAELLYRSLDRFTPA
jgi:pyrroloquinoline-quinone synthase